jgi:hypothetical protein
VLHGINASLAVDGNVSCVFGWLGRLTEPHDNPLEAGWKNPECEVWAGALNYADLPALLDRVYAVPWRHSERIRSC